MKKKRRIGLSIRRLKDDPWQKQIEGLRVGQLVEAKITRLTKFGAFAMLENNMEGLIHISEISDEHIGHPKEVLHEDDEVTLRIIKIEPDSHRVGLTPEKGGFTGVRRHGFESAGKRAGPDRYPCGW